VASLRVICCIAIAAAPAAVNVPRSAGVPEDEADLGLDEGADVEAEPGTAAGSLELQRALCGATGGLPNP